MRLEKKGISRIYIAVMIVSWTLTAYFSFQSIHNSDAGVSTALSDALQNVFLGTFIVSTFLRFKLQTGGAVGYKFNELIWRGFVLGSTLLLSLFFVYMTMAVVDPDKILYNEESPNAIFINTYYLINMAFIIIFVANIFYIYKRMVMFQRSRNLLISWNIFEYLTLLSVFTIFWDIDFLSNTYFEILIVVSIFVFGLSVNLKWVAYMNFNQKLRSVFLMSFILIIGLIFATYIYEQYDLFKHTTHQNVDGHYLKINLGAKGIVLISFSFVLIYSVSGVLVLLFNLPTSSVFEQKFSEVLNFQRLSQSIKMGDKEEKIYTLLLDSSINTVMAEAGWLEIYSDQDKVEIKEIFKQNIGDENIKIMRQIIDISKHHGNDPYLIRNLRKLNLKDDTILYKYKSAIAIKLNTHSSKIGVIYLLKKVKDGFDKELVEALSTFVDQASVTIENNKLVREAIENQRIKEEMKIARSVQQSLLPNAEIKSPYFDLSAFSLPATEVGGDYYDTFKLSDKQLAVVIGDVSGHGTSAAFHMAQLKGVFQSLIQLDISPGEFMRKANMALSRCLEKHIFVTLSIHFINFETNTITYARAGHCPAILYQKEQDQIFTPDSKGLGLGILRDESYNQYIKSHKISFQSGDLLVLYTDGITEMRNSVGVELDYEGLESMVKGLALLSAEEISRKIKENLNKYCGEKDADDDRTLVVIKFK